MASDGAMSGNRFISPLTPREGGAGTEAEPFVAVELPVVEPMEGEAVSPEVGVNDWLFGNTWPAGAAPIPFSVCCATADWVEIPSPVP